MIPVVTRVAAPVGGRELIFETGLLARQAGGAVVVRSGDSMVLVTATASTEPREGVDFFPLTCDFEERMYAAGKIPGGFFKREGRPGERAILSARLMDRPLRPLFPKGFRNDVQVIATVLSTDFDNDPAVLAVNGASAALCISDIPFHGPIGAVRMGLVGGELVINPTWKQLAEESALDLVVAASEDAIIMVEAGADEVPEARLLDALDLAHREIRKIIAAQRELMARVGKPKMAVPETAPDPELARAVRERALPLIREALVQPEKLAREDALRRVQEAVAPSLLEQFPDREAEIGEIIQALTKEEVRRMILEEGRRPDGRGLTDIRPLYIAVGVVPRAHGSGLFQRGQTQVLTVATLGTGEDEQIIDDITPRTSKRFMHHYSFPPYSVGEVRPLRSPGRREIGHGLLAERALEPMIPDESVFPYTIRLVSEVLESNGSTSMASVCGSTLALMDAGVPIRAPVAGIAMGLVTGPNGRAAVLTDILGLEDAMGDMDFKVAGTRLGVTALQMDIKVSGLTRDILARALEQARQARLYILDEMAKVIAEPRPTLSPYAPRIITIEISPDKIREVIGPGGKVINKITAETGVKIDIEQDGRVLIASTDEAAARRAIEMIQAIVRDVKVGEMYLGKVTRLMNFGAFVEVLPGKEGLVHISELSDGRVSRVEDVVKVGDELLVKVKEIDSQGRINLTRRGVTPPGEGAPAGTVPAGTAAAPAPSGPEQRRPAGPGGRRGRRRRRPRPGGPGPGAPRS
ncbi:MAG: polyribonucleotide nucleotidyltransferase [Armatimonadota bacterium]|nr:polyribonucleotide nucleotidyltransferase [Armatimonadota bacterium]MDR7436647.1 polyribonucleotide nucleotidyltransferase [Armatimonadota bacterium]MDR7472934.1 polyribonucleotide nucleotidyltransferase [Armatimonadota bacterium]MDR7507543.1 polyribonucleotide nucleotidyltransferase [Armatimonadota bacterium]MDR7510348.1 polyribonucleotide nucleotidyltransferase [Armatimonadota bacterium]